MPMTLDERTRNALLVAAEHAAEHAYAPYSGYSVGAAVLAPDGRIFAGCNVENSSYGLTVCAERNAVFAAVAAGQLRIAGVAIVSQAAEGKPAARFTPCGACLQVLAEFAGEDLPVVVDAVGDFTLKDLLGQPFRLR